MALDASRLGMAGIVDYEVIKAGKRDQAIRDAGGDPIREMDPIRQATDWQATSGAGGVIKGLCNLTICGLLGVLGDPIGTIRQTAQVLWTVGESIVTLRAFDDFARGWDAFQRMTPGQQAEFATTVVGGGAMAGASLRSVVETARVAKAAPATLAAPDIAGGAAVSTKSVGWRIGDPIENLTPEIRALSESHLTGSGTTVLGSYRTVPNYIDKANALKASYFDIGDAWGPLSTAQRAAANRHFLDLIADARERVLLSLPKQQIQAGTSLANEIIYLREVRQYRWVNQWSLRPPKLT